MRRRRGRGLRRKANGFAYNAWQRRRRKEQTNEMSTRSTIGMVVDGGAVDTVYCHFDGYPEGVGATLALWTEHEDIAKMMELGDMSSLGSALSECRFYHRDVGGGNTEEETRKVTFAFLSECVEDQESDIYIEYLYLFADDQWWIRALRGAGFYRLKDALIALDSARPSKHEHWTCRHGELDEIMAGEGIRSRLFTGHAPA